SRAMAALDLHHQLLEGRTQRHVRDGVRGHDLVGLEAALHRFHLRHRVEGDGGGARHRQVDGAGMRGRAPPALYQPRGALHSASGRTSAFTSSLERCPFAFSIVNSIGTVSPGLSMCATSISITCVPPGLSCTGVSAGSRSVSTTSMCMTPPVMLEACICARRASGVLTP